MKLPKELQNKYKKRFTNNDDEIFYAHSRCCNSHWILMWDNSKSKFQLVCEICGTSRKCIITGIDISKFFKRVCVYECGNYMLFSQCCVANWELCYNRNSNKKFIMCEICGSHAEKIKLDSEITREIKCKHYNPKFNKKFRSLY